MKQIATFEIQFEREGRQSNWTLVIERELDCPYVTFGLRYGDKLTLTHWAEERTDQVLNMLKELSVETPESDPTCIDIDRV